MRLGSGARARHLGAVQRATARIDCHVEHAFLVRRLVVWRYGCWVGVRRLTPRAFGLGGGVKYFPWNAIGARASIRYTPTLLNDDDAADFCDPFGFCQGALQQIEIAVGAVVRF